MARDITVTIAAGALEVTLSAEDVSWSPDVAADLVTRAIGAFNEALGVCHLYAEGDDDDADDDDD